MPYNQEVLDGLVKAQDAFVWEAPDREERQRGPRWYLIMSAIALAFVVYAVATGNFLFAFIVLLVAIILVLAGNQAPENVLIQIGKNGVVVDGKLYEFKDLNKFAIIYHPPETKVLYIESKKALSATDPHRITGAKPPGNPDPFEGLYGRGPGLARRACI
jgi:hypothetical protein